MAALGRRRRPRPAPAERSTDLDAAREAALELLDRARRTRSDLARRLVERGFAAPTIAEALDRLAGVGLVDDVEYARAFLRSRGARRPAGRRRLEQELRARGVAADDLAAAFEREGGARDEAGGAARVVALAARRYHGLDPRLRRQRLYALLVRRGFDREAIEAALAGAPGPDDPERE